MTCAIKAIETEYKGYRFRSRLEARWAVFFDACGVKWEYEPEGFDLGDGIWYLPDFLLHDVYTHHGGGDTPDYWGDLWVEIKGQMTDADRDKLRRFATPKYWIDADSANPLLICLGFPEGETAYDLLDWCSNADWKYQRDWAPPFPYNFGEIDGDNYTAFPCIAVGKHFALVGGDYWGSVDEEATETAYRIARQARFEHGEHPQTNPQIETRNVDILTAPDGTNIDVVTVPGYSTKFVKVARVSTAVGYSNPSINENSPLMKAAAWLGLPKYFFKSQRLSGNDSYGKNTYFFAVGDVPRILAQYYEMNDSAKQGAKKNRRAQAALNLRDWFQSTVLPRYEARA